MLSAWDSDVARLTEPYRERRAREHEAKAKEQRREVKVERAARLEAEAEIARREGDAAAFVPVPYTGDVALAGRWHRQRARGQRERFDRVDSCTKNEIVDIRCEACGAKSERAARCRVALVCTSCRGKIAGEKQAKLALNRRAALDLVAKAGLLRTKRHGGRWSEKFMTLTIPHFACQDIPRRVAFGRAALARFAPMFAKWLREHPDGGFLDSRGHRLARWLRHAEWTPGDDERGHPHWHFYFLGPFIEEREGGRHVLGDMWRRALVLAAKDFAELRGAALEERQRLLTVEPVTAPVLRGPLTSRRLARLTDRERSRKRARARRSNRDHSLGAFMPRPIVDIRKVEPGHKSLKEIIKYLFKDLVRPQLTLIGNERERGKGTAVTYMGRLDPPLYAQVYEAYDGTRSTQGSRGFMGLAAHLETHSLGKGAVCKCCGVFGEWRVLRRPLTLEEQGARAEEWERRRQERLAKCGRAVPANQTHFANVEPGRLSYA